MADETIQILRSSVAGRRPTGRQAGELYVNYADDRMGWTGADGTPRDLPYVHRTGGTVEGGIYAKGPLTSDQVDAESNARVNLRNTTAAITASFETDRSNGNLMVGRRDGTEAAAWHSRALFTFDDVVMSGLKPAPDGASIMTRDRSDARFIRRALPDQGIDGNLHLNGHFRVTLGSTFDGGMLVKGNLVANGEMRTDQNLTAGKNVHVGGGLVFLHAPATGTAQVRFHNRDGSTIRGIAYAAEDGSFVRLLKYNPDQTTDVYVNLVAGDIRAHGMAAAPASGDSLMTRLRGDNRYIKAAGQIRDEAAAYLRYGHLGSVVMGVVSAGTTLSGGSIISGASISPATMNIASSGAVYAGGSGSTLSGSWQVLCISHGRTDGNGNLVIAIRVA